MANEQAVFAACFHHGYLAGKRGQPHYENPHPRALRAYDIWRMGWKAGIIAKPFSPYPEMEKQVAIKAEGEPC